MVLKLHRDHIRFGVLPKAQTNRQCEEEEDDNLCLLNHMTFDEILKKKKQISNHPHNTHKKKKN